MILLVKGPVTDYPKWPIHFCQSSNQFIDIAQKGVAALQWHSHRDDVNDVGEARTGLPGLFYPFSNALRVTHSNMHISSFLESEMQFTQHHNTKTTWQWRCEENQRRGCMFEWESVSCLFCKRCHVAIRWLFLLCVCVCAVYLCCLHPPSLSHSLLCCSTIWQMLSVITALHVLSLWEQTGAADWH